VNEQGQLPGPVSVTTRACSEWIIGRCEGTASARETTLGWMPNYEDLDWAGSDFSREEFAGVTSLDKQAWLNELAGVKDWFGRWATSCRQAFRHS